MREELGSSPRMRGAQPLGLLVEGKRGIIPAYAGSTKTEVTDMYKGEDHPRVCGEHYE